MAASFPGSVKVFQTRSNGQVIDAAHVNDVQDEINAIEDGYLNSRAPLNTSNASVNNLQVNGNSTFVGSFTLSTGLSVGGALTVAGNSSLTGALHVGGASTLVGNLRLGGLVTASSNPRVHASHSVVQQLSSASTTSLLFDTEIYDVGGFHSTSVSAAQFTVPAGSSGLYWAEGCIFVNTLGAAMSAHLVKNGARVRSFQKVISASVGETLAFGVPLQLDGGDICEITVQSNLSTLSVGLALLAHQNQFSLTKLW